jgi:uncharacterized protein (TIGR02266 family)
VAGQDSRVGERQSASMRIKLKYPDVETFVQKYAVNISRGGIFIATKQPKAIGTYLRFEFLLSDAGQTSIIRGEGQVQWTKEFDAANPSRPHGMGVKFMRLDAESQAVIDRALKWRAEHGTSPSVALPPATPRDAPVARKPMATATEPPAREEPTPTDTTNHAATARMVADEAEPTARVSADETAATAEPAREASQARRLPTARVSADETAATAEPAREASQARRLPTARVSADETAATAEPAREASQARRLPTRNGSQAGHLPEPPREPLPDVSAAAPTRGETRPIAIGDDEVTRRGPFESTREIRLPEPPPGRARDEIDSLAAEWGLSEERVSRTLKRARPRMVEATAELERLLLKPPKAPTPTKAEAVAQLSALLAKKPPNGKNSH